LLLREGAAIEAKHDELRSAIHLAAKNDHQKVLQLLLDSGAAIEAENVNLNTAIHVAAIKGHQEVVHIGPNSFIGN
jgi:ankyrin repeat protein